MRKERRNISQSGFTNKNRSTNVRTACGKYAERAPKENSEYIYMALRKDTYASDILYYVYPSKPFSDREYQSVDDDA